MSEHDVLFGFRLRLFSLAASSATCPRPAG